MKENLFLTASAHYPTKRAIKRHARNVGVNVSFMDKQEFAFRHPNSLLRHAGSLLQRYMVLKLDETF